MPENVKQKQEFKASIYNDTVDAIDSLGSYFNIPHVSRGDFIYGSYFKKIELYLDDWKLKTSQCSSCNINCDDCVNCQGCNNCNGCVTCNGGCNNCNGSCNTCNNGCSSCNSCVTCQSDNPEPTE